MRSDLLVESFLALVRTHPIKALLAPFWLLKGRGYLKERVADLVDLDVASLPYDQGVLAFVVDRRNAGWRTVLATASHRKFADLIAQHLGAFDDVVATDRGVNLSGASKRAALVERYGEGGFDYVGDSLKDLPVWAAAHSGIVANANKLVEAAARRVTTIESAIGDGSGRLSAYAHAMRPHQWLKNLLIFVPLLLSHRILDWTLVVDAVTAFVAFGLTASSVYILNDLFDLQADRAHSRKRHRAFAAGAIPIWHGLFLAPALLLCAGLLCLLLPPAFFLSLCVYYAITLAYSLGLKRLIMVDVITLASLYTIRIFAGGAVSGEGLSYWLLTFSVFLFLSLALVKRYSELEALSRSGGEKAAGRGYHTSDLSILASLGAASGFVAVLVSALYINSVEVVKLYSRPELLWLTCAVLLFWISRVWLLVHRGEVHEDPVVFALRDPGSLIAGLVAGAILLVAA